MRQYGVFFLLAAALAAPMAIGQPGDKPEATPAVDERVMYEDIEIMRRLLLRHISGRSTVASLSQCTVCHKSNTLAYFDTTDGAGPPRSAVLYQDVTRYAGVAFADHDKDGWADLFVANGAHPHGGATSFALEGSYLKGHGVVYHLTLPAAAREELAASPPVSAAKVDSDWEQTRRQVRGEAGTPAPAKKTTLVDVLLQVLADNGKNFKNLPADEKLTIIVTFRGGSNLPAGPWHSVKPASNGGANSSPPPLNSDGGGSGPVGGTEAPISPDREFELLADLHLKRGNLNDALTAFDRALTQANEALIRADAGAMDRAKARVRELSRKLAETHLKLNNFEGARKALEAGEVGKGNAPKPKAEPAPVALPGKLIVSVSKRALDLAGTSALPPEEFRKHVTIESPTK